MRVKTNVMLRRRSTVSPLSAARYYTLLRAIDRGAGDDYDGNASCKYVAENPAHDLDEGFFCGSDFAVHAHELSCNRLLAGLRIRVTRIPGSRHFALHRSFPQAVMADASAI